MSEEDDSQKTEDPTQRRIEDAIKRGQVATSREVTNFLFLLFAAMVIGFIGPKAMHMTVARFSNLIEHPDQYSLDNGSLQHVMAGVLFHAAIIMLMLVSGAILVAIVGSYLQHGHFIWSAESMKPKLNKISILKGFKRIFSLKSFVELIKGLIKICIIGTVAYIAAAPYIGELRELPGYAPADLLEYIRHVALRMMIGVCVAMGFIAILDYLYQRYDYFKGLRMSRQEVRDEYRQQEGDPHVKGKIKSIRMERARKRMMANVPDADVVITNPTHFAVALKYDNSKMKAPILTAKGADVIARKIREIAEEHKVPIVQNPPVARALYDNVELDQEIPLEYYKAVAEVIGYVYRLKGKGPKPQPKRQEEEE